MINMITFRIVGLCFQNKWKCPAASRTSQWVNGSVGGIAGGGNAVTRHTASCEKKASSDVISIIK